ncbi:MAG: hypothetical protein GF317_13405, partial [Candidatus Lokiarchaeota archaeon]|nr:hypothetical protein [Candidatus Lokiarchaeota archaeon]MBD3200634.1 hypothetical protein [Candidatus Lokiarchaeota archaeon]
IMGVGGLGGTLTEQLVRVGCQNIVICDKDIYDITNLNRQLCTENDIGSYKVDHLARYLKNIDSSISIQKFTSVSSDNIKKLLKNVKVVCLSLDDPIASILIARFCKKNEIPMVESWGIPYLWAWWFTKQSIDYESCYQMNTKHLDTDEIEHSELIGYKSFLPKLTQFPKLRDVYDRQEGYFEKMKNGEIPYRSFAPFVHLTASYLAVEIVFAGLLNVKDKILAPNILGYDYIRMKEFRFQMK